MDARMLARAQTSFLYTHSRTQPTKWSYPHSGWLFLPQHCPAKTIPHTYVRRLTLSAQLLLETIFPDEARWCQADNPNHRTQLLVT